MADITQKLHAVLQQNGASLTRPRLAVLKALQHREPQTMHQLIELCEPLDRASVYRTVALFERLGVVQRLQTGWKYKLELAGDFHTHHHHATCLKCGSSFVFPEDKMLEKQLHDLAERHGFRLQRHQLELQGMCAECIAAGTKRK